MKVLDKTILKEKDYFSYVKLERQILMSLEHPFILKLNYSFQCLANLYLVLDYEGGGTLFFHLKKKRRFTEQEIIFYAAEIILAIEYLHSKKIIYRDLKPENVLLSQDGHIKLADFGLAKKLTNFGNSMIKRNLLHQNSVFTNETFEPQKPASLGQHNHLRIQKLKPEKVSSDGGDDLKGSFMSENIRATDKIQDARKNNNKAFSMCGTP